MLVDLRRHDVGRRRRRRARSSMNRFLRREQPDRSRAPHRPAPATTASSRNGSWVYQRVAPTSRMMPTSVRRVNAAICTMLAISSIAAIACTSAIANAALRMPSSTLNSRSTSSRWSSTLCTPGRAGEGVDDDAGALRVAQLDLERGRQRSALTSVGELGLVRRTAPCSARSASARLSRYCTDSTRGRALQRRLRRFGTGRLAAVGVGVGDVVGEVDLHLDPVEEDRWVLSPSARRAARRRTGRARSRWSGSSRWSS